MIVELRKGGAVTMTDGDFEVFTIMFSRAIHERDPVLAEDDSQRRVGMLRRDVEQTYNNQDFIDIAVYSLQSANSYNLVYDESVEIKGWRFA